MEYYDIRIVVIIMILVIVRSEKNDIRIHEVIIINVPTIYLYIIWLIVILLILNNN